jgi:SAM-dependent methyltransferase
VTGTGGPVVEVGCGTGQIISAFHRAGFPVVGVDISAAMLAVARRRLPTVPMQVGSAYHLPYATGSAGVVVVSKLFQHLADWPLALREMVRVLRPGGVLLHVRDRGAFTNDVRVRVARAADARGYSDRYLGTTDQSRLHAEVIALGGRVERVPCDGLTWVKSITYGTALAQLRERLFAEFWVVPDAEYETILADVDAWVAAQPEGPRTSQRTHPYLEIDAFRFEAARRRDPRPPAPNRTPVEAPCPTSSPSSGPGVPPCTG